MLRSVKFAWVIALAIAAVIHAQTWTGASFFSSNWSDNGTVIPPGIPTPGNWNTGVPSPGAGTVVNFGAAPRLNPNQDLANPFDLNQLNFIAGAGAPYVLGGGAIRMAGATTMVTQQSAGNHRINNELILPTTNTFYRFSGNGLGTLTLGGAVTGSGILLKQGTHTLVLDAPLTASSDLSTALSVEGGTFRVNQSNLIHSSLHLFTSGGATFDLNGKDQTFALTFASGTIQLGGGKLTLGVNPGTGGGSVSGIVGGGELIKGPGSTQFVAANSLFTGATTVKNQGTIFLQANGALGTTDVGTLIESGGSIHVTGTQYTDAEPLTLSGFGTGVAALRGSSGALFAGPITLTADSNIGSIGGAFRLTGGIDLGSSTARFGDFGGSVIVEQNGISGTGGLRKIIPNETLVISAPCTYTGPTSVESGIMEVNTSLQTASINVSFFHPVSARGTLRGNVTALDAALTVSGNIEPGLGTGTMDVASAALLSGGRYQWDIDDPDAAPGDGFDVLSMLGELSAPNATGFAILMRSLTPGGAAGPLDGFDNTQPYSWLAIDAASFNANVALADFTLDASGFTSFNDLAGGMLGLDLVGSDVFVRFTPVPETATAALMVLVIGAIAARRQGRPSR